MGVRIAFPQWRDTSVIRVGINGFGRIGRGVVRALYGAPSHRSTRPGETGRPIQIVGVNDLVPAPTLAHLLENDSIFGPFKSDGVRPVSVFADGNSIRIGDDGMTGAHVPHLFVFHCADGEGQRTSEFQKISIPVFSERDPGRIPWGELGADIVVESTGLFTKAEKARAHLEAGARRVIISAPAEGEDITIVMGVNHDQYDPDAHRIVSNGSCTTNCLAPVAKVLNDAFGIESGIMSTVHAYTNDQNLHDQGHRDLRRARAGTLSMIPSSTGAAVAIGRVLPELDMKLTGSAIRVPVPDVSVIEFVVNLRRFATAEQINNAFREAAEGHLNGILGYTEKPLVSSDYVGNPLSATVDGPLTLVVPREGEGSMVKVTAWYDNEWGFSNRMVDLIRYMAPPVRHGDRWSDWDKKPEEA